MKAKFEFEINKANISKFFPENRLKDKIHLIEILLEATRSMINTEKLNSGVNRTDDKFILKIDKMSRLFFVTKEKYYSIVFPFLARIENEKLKFSYINGVEIDSQVISNIIEIIKSESFTSDCCCEFVDPIMEAESSITDFWNILRELLILEDGYIRFDHDKKNHKIFKEKGQEHKHPLNHCDIFISNSGTFKVGVKRKIVYSDFVDLLDSNKNCMYLN